MRNIFRNIILVSILFFFWAAAAQTPKIENSTPIPKSFHGIKIEYVDESHNAIRPTPAPKVVILSFLLIPGNLGGKIGTDPILIKEVQDSETFELDLYDVYTKVEELSIGLVKNDYSREIEIQPSDVKLSRVGTFAQEKVSNKKYGGGFRDIETGDTLVLVYFSGACDVTGTGYNQRATFDFSVHIYKPGFHWLRANKLAESQYLVTSHEPSAGVFFLVIDKEANKS
jgi:hypothetical protein